jgi:hypothetical protein
VIETSELLLVSYTSLLFLQTVHIFEEIAARAYELVGSPNKYLVVASLLLPVSYSALILMLLGVQVGMFIAILASLVALGNGIIHLTCYVKTRSYTASLGSGVFSGIPLGIMGGLVLVQVVLQTL